MNNFNFKKKFGQNFISDKNILNKIVNGALIEENALVIEIGLGKGSLTKIIANQAQDVIGYEIDSDLEETLKKELPDNVHLIIGDFLRRDLKNDLAPYQYDKLYVIANLPYYITTPIITKVIEDNIRPDKMVLMMQKEVADRITASVSTKDYNSLTVFINYHYDTKKLFDVSRNIFYPKPNVDSAVVLFELKKELPYIKDRDLFFKFVRDAFKYKRKNLKNNLLQYDLEKIKTILQRHNLDLNARAEQVSMALFIEIVNNL